MPPQQDVLGLRQWCPKLTHAPTKCCCEYPGVIRIRPPSSSGLGRRPFTAVARVRIPLGVRIAAAMLMQWYKQGPVAQLVSAPPCHGGGRGFESRQGRQKVSVSCRTFRPGSSVGTSVRLKSGRSPVRSRPWPPIFRWIVVPRHIKREREPRDACRIPIYFHPFVHSVDSRQGP